MIYDVSINRLEQFCVFDLTGSRAAITACLAARSIVLPKTPNTTATVRSTTLCWVEPARWLLLASHSDAQNLTSEFKNYDSGDHSISIIEVSDMLQFFSIQGRDADEILAVCCPIDIHLTEFPDNAVTYTEMLGTKALVLRDTHGFQVAVDRSYADFIDDSLHRILGKSLPVNHAGQPVRKI